MSLFFIGSESGTVWYANESKCDELCKLSSGVISIMFYQQSQSLVLITENFDMRLARITSNMTAPEKKVRLSLTVDARFVKICWMDPCSFGITSWDNIVRIWNLKDDSNYSLNLSDLNRDTGGGVAFVMGGICLPSDKIVCSEYNKQDHTVYCGTSNGKIIAWKSTLEGSVPSANEHWRNIGNLGVGSMINNIKVGNSGLIVCEYNGNLSLIYQNKLAGVMSSNFKIIQTSNTMLQIYYLDSTGTPKVS